MKRKAATFGADITSEADAAAAAAAGSNGGGGGGGSQKIDPEAVARLYEQWVMPLTKEVEVQYLLARLDGE